MSNGRSLLGHCPDEARARLGRSQPAANWAVNRKQVQRGTGPEHREAGDLGLKREAGQQREDSGGRSPNEPCN